MNGKVAVTAYVGIGSNQEQPIRQVRSAMAELAALPGSSLRATSRLYRSAPLGPASQPDYINAAVALDTALPAEKLLAELQAVERRHGRVRAAVRWGPRSLDLDLLLYGDATLNTADLTVPHPGVSERLFVLYPLADIAPDLDVPGHGPVATLLARCAPARIEVLGENTDE